MSTDGKKSNCLHITLTCGKDNMANVARPFFWG